MSGLWTAHLSNFYQTHLMKHCFAALLSAIALISCMKEETSSVLPEHGGNIPKESSEYVYGEARVYFSEDMTEIIEQASLSGSIMTKSEDMNNTMMELGITEMYRLFPHAGEYEPRTRKEGLHRWYVVKYDPQITMTKAQTVLEGVQGVEIFEPVRQIQNSDFNDFSSELWGLYNTSYKGFDINVKPVWENYTVGNKDVIVSVVDNGVDLNHEDLSANCLPSGSHYNSIDDNSVIVAGDHGTHVAGTIAAVGNNGKGIVGVAGGDYANGIHGVSIMSCQIFKTNADGSTTSGGTAPAIKYGADHGAVISQNSWGYNYDADNDGKLTGDEYTKAMAAKITGSDKAAVDYFIKYAGCDNYGNQLQDSPMKGGVVIFAAGNEAIANGAPAGYESIIAVGSVTESGTRSSFSNYGDWVDICAPGSNILSTVPNGGYATMSGTSMACPHVSGVAALIVSHFGGPGFTNEMLKEKLLGSANKSIVSQAYQIGGLVDAYGAFVYGNDKAPAEVTDLRVEGRGDNLDLTFTTTSDPDGKAAYGYLALYGTDRDAVLNAVTSDYSNVGYKVFVPENTTTQEIVCTIDKLEFEQTYYVKLLAYSYGRNYSAATDVKEAVTTVNNPPVITPVTEGEYSIYSYETLNVYFDIVEPDGHDLDVVMDSSVDAATLTNMPDGSYRFSVKGKDAEIGTYKVTITATDSYGLSASHEFEYTIKENQAPVVIKQIEDRVMNAKGRELTIDLTEHVYDPDGEQLKYEVSSSNAKVLHANPKNNSLIITSLAYGTSEVTVVAKDARGESVELKFKVTVRDPSDPLSLYPNPVKDYLYVATLDMAETQIRVYNSTGYLMVAMTAQVSGTEPAEVDMRDYAPGVYSVQVTFGGKEYKKNIVKL